MHSPPFRPPSRCSDPTGWTPPTCLSSTARHSSGSRSRSSSSSAASSSRSCPATRCSSPWGCSSRPVRCRSTSGWPIVALCAAAFLGNVVGYEIGRGIGTPLYERDGRILKKKYFDETTALLRQARQQGPRHRPVRADRAHLHHRRRRGEPDGPPPLLHVERRRCRALGRWPDPPRLLPRRSPSRGSRTSLRSPSCSSSPSRCCPCSYEYLKQSPAGQRHRRGAEGGRRGADRVRR